MTTKLCNKCEEQKDVSHFYKDKNRKDGFSLSCGECERKRLKLYRKNNVEKVKEKYKKDKLKNPNYIKEWNKKNPKYSSEYEKKRRSVDPLFYLRKKVRNRLRDYIKSKNKKSVDYLGCSYEFLKEHLEKQFKEGMCWENRNEWHIDHIIPLSSAKTEDELYKLCHYTNLQPLWAIDNIKKGKKLLNFKS